jgi:hypothetical protein
MVLPILKLVWIHLGHRLLQSNRWSWKVLRWSSNLLNSYLWDRSIDLWNLRLSYLADWSFVECAGCVLLRLVVWLDLWIWFIVLIFVIWWIINDNSFLFRLWNRLLLLFLRHLEWEFLLNLLLVILDRFLLLNNLTVRFLVVLRFVSSLNWILHHPIFFINWILVIFIFFDGIFLVITSINIKGLFMRFLIWR